MDKCTTEVRRKYWKGIIAQCHARPQGQTTRDWLRENQICEATYYLWQRRIRQETFNEITNLPQANDVTFAEVSMPVPTLSEYSNPVFSGENVINPVAVIKTGAMTIALAPDISDHLLSRIIQEVAHA